MSDTEGVFLLNNTIGMSVNKRKILEHMLRFMARAVLRKYQPMVVGITGSVGKSSAKEATALVIARAYSVRKAEGNYNNEVGVPLTILGVHSGGGSFFHWGMICFKWLGTMLFPVKYPEVLILEMGIDRPGDMEYLLQFVSLKIGIATQVSGSHLAYFGSITNIAKEKGKLISSLPEDGFAILNADDKRTKKMQEKTKAKVFTYGFDESAIVRADNLIFHRDVKRIEGFSFKLNVDGKSIPVRLPKIVAKHHIPAALAAASVGLALRMNLVEIVESLEAFEPLPGRLRLLAGRSDTALLDDTYNASPASTRAALEVVGELMAPRKIVVLGDMLEIGPESAEEHARLAPAVIESGAHIVVTVGKHMRALHEALLESGYARKQLMWIPDPLSAMEALSTIIRSDDLILIKGSRSMRMEKITEMLLINPEEAAAVLCCQSPEWRAKPFSEPAEWVE